jgi:hypothetical protein
LAILETSDVGVRHAAVLRGSRFIAKRLMYRTPGMQRKSNARTKIQRRGHERTAEGTEKK